MILSGLEAVSGWGDVAKLLAGSGVQRLVWIDDPAEKNTRTPVGLG